MIARKMFSSLGVLIIINLGVVIIAGDSNWWTHGTFYHLYPRSFKDDNNDGIGDLKGIISKLPYLKHTGVTGIWLSPIYSSPQVDQGYDISDYKSIQEEYGTLQEFDELLKKAKKLNVKVIMDFVPNHTSNKHKWFISSENSEPKYKDYYVWHNGNGKRGPPNNWRSVFKNSAWKYSAKRKQYYLHQFAEEQPDLNFNNPDVVKEMKDVMKFWLDKGVDGFRLDAVPFIFEGGFKDEPLSGNSKATADDYDSLSHIYTTDQPQTYDLIYNWREYFDQYNKKHGGDERIMMGEAYTNINNTVLYYGDNKRNGVHFSFNFFLIPVLNKDVNANAVEEAINNWLNRLPNQFSSNWVIGNHDNRRVASRVGKERVDGFNMLVALLPGIAVTYNGEEIGMEDGEITWAQGKDPWALKSKKDFAKVSRDFERTPFQWDNTTNAGFNAGAKTWLPVCNKYLDTNLASQIGTGSHYTIYRNMLTLRKKKVFEFGSTLVKALSKNVLLLERALDGDVYILVFNIGDSAEVVNLNSVTALQYFRVLGSSTKSKFSYGDIVDVRPLNLQPHECIVGSGIKPKSSSAIGKHLSCSILFIVLLMIYTVK